MPTGKRRSRPGRARYWRTGASAAHLLPFSQALTLSLRLLDSLSTTNVNGAGLGFTWDPYSTELQNPPFPGSATLMRPFPPPASPDPCLPGTNLHCSMNSTSWLTGAQYGWKFLKTACQRSWQAAWVSCAPSCGSTAGLPTLKVRAARGRGVCP